jgi:hypothetical protein
METPRQIKYGLSIVSGDYYTRKQAQRFADKLAAHANKSQSPPGFWHGVVCSAIDDRYWRVSLAGQVAVIWRDN